MYLLAFPGPSSGLSILDHPPLLLKRGLVHGFLHYPSLPFGDRIGGRNAVSKGLNGGGGAFGGQRERKGERGRRGQNPSHVLLSDGAGLGEEILQGNSLVALWGGGGGVDGGGISVSGDGASRMVGVSAGNDLLPDIVDGLGGRRGDGLEKVVHGG